jgi:hypothetical protein
MLLPWLLFQQVVCYHWIPSTCEVPVKYLWLTSRFFFVSSSDGASTTGNTAFQDKGFDPIGWELVLVTAPSNTTSSASVGQLVCFFNHRIIFLMYLCFHCMFKCCGNCWVLSSYVLTPMYYTLSVHKQCGCQLFYLFVSQFNFGMLSK